MALRKCRECKGSVSSKATVCPHCGAPIKKAGGAGGVSSGCGCLIIIAVIVGIAVFASQDDDRRTVPMTNPQSSTKRTAKRPGPTDAKALGRPEAGRPKPKTHPKDDARTQKPPKATRPKLTAQQWQYLSYALAYNRAAREQGRTPPVLFGSATADVGVFPGRFEVLQVLRHNVMIVSKLDSHDIPGQSYRVDNISSAEQADGDKLSFGQLVLAHEGSWSYLTVLGAKRTIRHLAIVNKTMLSSAQRRIIQEARDRVGKIVAKQKSFKKRNRHVAQFISASQRIRLYEPHAKERPDMAKLVAAERKRLATAGAVSKSEVKAYKAKLLELSARVKAARAELAKRIADAPKAD